MAERRMAKIVRQARTFNDLSVETRSKGRVLGEQPLGEATSNLRNLDAVGQPIVKDRALSALTT